MHKGDTKDSWRYDITRKDYVLPGALGSITCAWAYWSSGFYQSGIWIGLVAATGTFMAEIIAANLRYRWKVRN